MSCISEIDAIRARVVSKLFTKFANIDNYCQAYLKIYRKISSQLTNKNGHKQQVKNYKVFYKI